MKFSKKILQTFIDLPKDYIDLMEDVGLEVKSEDGDILNLELLANRGDHYCYVGLAREIAGRTGAPINTKESLAVEWREVTPDLFLIETKKCLAYSLLPLKKNQQSAPGLRRGDGNQQSDYIQTMLPSSGVNLILDIIDITNVVMLELGQPAHVYDADKIKGKIKIRETVAGETAALLFHEGLTELPVGTMVIADDEKILCVAGVIGCRDAADVDENTKNILLETALFDPVSIRKTAKNLGVSSIASQIFERGGNVDAISLGAARAKYLYKQIGWEQSGDRQSSYTEIKQRHIKMSGDYVREQLEINITDAEINERLARYGFERMPNAEYEYRTPSWRVWDIKGERADLIEELCRSLGYNSLPSKLPSVSIGATLTPAEIRRREIDAYLVNNGFYEVMTDTLYSPRHAKLSYNLEHIGLENSVDGGYSYLRNNTIVQAAELVSKNLNVKNREIRAYEWGKIFTKDGEREILWGVMNGAKISALDLKGIIEGIGFKTIPADLSEFLIHPKRGAKFEYGFFGEIHPGLLSEFDIKNDAPVYFEIDSNAMLNTSAPVSKYESPSSIIPSTRDISISVPYGKYAGDVVNYILKNFKDVSDVKITDVFEKPKEKVRNVTYTLTFTGEHSADELNSVLQTIMNGANKLIMDN